MELEQIYEKGGMSKICFALLLILLSACSWGDLSKNRLEAALDFAGDNRRELEKVLEHYKKDSLKLKAAEFLISNMPHYYSYKGAELDSAQALLVQIAHNKELGQNSDFKTPWRSFNYYSLPRVYDAHIIKADYLIDNIERAFKAWKNRPWNSTLPFDDFCELLLPYRIGDEPLSDWRPLYEDYYVHFLDSAYQGKDVLEACGIINDELCRQDCKFFSKMAVPHYDAAFLYHNRTGYCRENCDLGLYAMRVCGIPIASETFKYSPDYKNSHQWLTVRDTTGHFIQFGYDSMKPQRKQKQHDGRKKGKVYRYCFGEQNAQRKKFENIEYFPKGLANIYMKDVTANYFGSNRVTVPIEKDVKSVFLGVFATDGWKPIDVGRVNNCHATFVDIEPNVIYMPLTYDGAQKLSEAGYPFIYDAKTRKVKVLKAGKQSWEKVSLSRKMPLRERDKKWLWKGIIGTRIEACEDSSFRNSYLLCEFKDTLDYCNVKIKNHSKRHFQYIRYTVPDDVKIEMAGLGVYEDSLCQRQIPICLQTKVDSLLKPQRITDGDMVTAFEGTDDFHSLIFQMERKASIGCVDFYPRTDCNYVWKGDRYELFYQDGIHGWKSLGVKTAAGRNIEFNAPKNTVLWLRDLTVGVEEQIFICHDGKQQFVYEM